MQDNQKKPLVETGKFVLRLALLIGLPLLVAHQADLKGVWADVVGVYLPILLPIVDKWIHEDPRIPAKGISPF